MLSAKTKTDIAKMAVNMLVAGKATQLIENQLEAHTEIDTDHYGVHIGCVCAGHMVAARVRPQTDAAVDKAVARYQSWKLDRQAKKDAEDK